MTKKKVDEAPQEEVLPDQTQSESADPVEKTVQELVDKTATKPAISVVTIEVHEDGQLHINASHPNYPNLQWLLNRAQFELLLIEHQQLSNLIDTKQRAEKAGLILPS